MPVTLPDITVETVTVEIRGVAVPVRGFTLLELGKVIATSPAIAAALAGRPAALLGDTDLLMLALATCADLTDEQIVKLTSAEQATLLKEIIRLTVQDAIGPFVDLAASLGGAAEDIEQAVQKSLSKKS